MVLSAVIRLQSRVSMNVSQARGALYLCSELVRVWCSPRGLAGGMWPANLEEICEEGATLVLDNPLRVGARVEVKCRNYVLRGVVDSCTADELGYTVWVEFDRESRWSPNQYRPAHLLNPAALHEKVYCPAC